MQFGELRPAFHYAEKGRDLWPFRAVFVCFVTLKRRSLFRVKSAAHSKAADGDIAVVRSLFDGAYLEIVALAAAHIHIDTVAGLSAHNGAAHGGLLADPALQGILPQGGDQLDLSAFAQILHEDLHGVIEPGSISGGPVLDDLGGLDHPLEVADAGVVAVFLLLGALVLEVLAKVAEGPGGLDILDQLGAQLLHPVVDLLLHFLQVGACQFIIHGHSPSIRRQDAPGRREAGPGRCRYS